MSERPTPAESPCRQRRESKAHRDGDNERYRKRDERGQAQLQPVLQRPHDADGKKRDGERGENARSLIQGE
jgi:hypothetical protein